MLLSILLAAVVYFAFYFSSPLPYYSSDHTYRIAKAVLDGELGVPQSPENDLAEMVPLNDRYYSVFPFGSVATMLPLAALNRAGWIDTYPALEISASVAALVSILLVLIAARYPISTTTQLAYATYVIFGSWIWCCMIFLGPWQLNLGISMIGQLGAIYFILIRFLPSIAGFFFALAFGHRTEVILLVPVFFYLVVRTTTARNFGRSTTIIALVRFCIVPFILGVLTLWYNYSRFGSIADFGYGRIPGVLSPDNYTYRHGIMAFSLEYIHRNYIVSIVQGWRCIGSFPYIVPEGFGGSIFLYSPFLFLIFRVRSLNRELKIVSLISIALLTLSLWTHGEPGGWQYSYRYATILLPWFFLILLDSSKQKLSLLSWCLLGLSVGMNAYGTYLFHWTDYVGIPGGSENPCPFWLLKDSWLFH